MQGVTSYSGLAQFYFRCLLKKVIKVGRLHRPGITILDFGCGHGLLKSTLGAEKVFGYDIISELSDVSDWRTVDFDVLVANQVFYSFSAHALECLFQDLRQKNPAMELVVGISRQGVMNNAGKYLLGRPDAHAASRLTPKQEVAILEKYCEVIERRSCMALADIYYLRLKIEYL